MKRRNFLKFGLASGVVAAAWGMEAARGWAQELQRLQLLIPSGPGGGWDITGRTVDQVLRTTGMVNSSRIANVPGAGGTVGLATFVNQHRGDEDAILVGGLVMVTNIISNKAPVDLSAVQPIARLTGEYEVIAVPAASKYATIAELLEDMKKAPGNVSLVGGSAGGTDHIVGAMVAKAIGVTPSELTYVGYPSGGEIQAAVLGGQAAAGISGLSEFREHANAGGMRILAITAPERLPGLDVPTFREAGVDVELLNWRGLFAAPDTTPDAVERLRSLIGRMVETEEWKVEMKRRDWLDVYLPGDAFGNYVADEADRLRATLADLGLA